MCKILHHKKHKRKSQHQYDNRYKRIADIGFIKFVVHIINIGYTSWESIKPI